MLTSYDFFLKGCELKVPNEIGSLNVCPFLFLFCGPPLGDFWRAVVYFQPHGPWEYEVPISAAFIVAVTKNVYKEAAFLHVPLTFFLFLDLHCYFGVELISDITFISSFGGSLLHVDN